MVILREENVPPLQWKLGRIVELSLDYSEHNRTVAASAFRTVKLNSVPGNESYYSGRRPCRIELLPYESSPTFILYGTGTVTI
jgi:hypothetical protein